MKDCLLARPGTGVAGPFHRRRARDILGRVGQGRPLLGLSCRRHKRYGRDCRQQGERRRNSSPSWPACAGVAHCLRTHVCLCLRIVLIHFHRSRGCAEATFSPAGERADRNRRRAKPLRGPKWALMETEEGYGARCRRAQAPAGSTGRGRSGCLPRRHGRYCAFGARGYGRARVGQDGGRAEAPAGAGLPHAGTATCGCSDDAGRLHHRGPLQFDSRAGHDHDRRSRAEGRCHRSETWCQGVTTGSRIIILLSGPARHGAPMPTLVPPVAGKWSVQGRGPDLHTL